MELSVELVNELRNSSSQAELQEALDQLFDRVNARRIQLLPNSPLVAVDWEKSVFNRGFHVFLHVGFGARDAATGAPLVRYWQVWSVVSFADGATPKQVTGVQAILVLTERETGKNYVSFSFTQRPLAGIALEPPAGYASDKAYSIEEQWLKERLDPSCYGVEVRTPTDGYWGFYAALDEVREEVFAEIELLDAAWFCGTMIEHPGTSTAQVAAYLFLATVSGEQLQRIVGTEGTRRALILLEDVTREVACGRVTWSEYMATWFLAERLLRGVDFELAKLRWPQPVARALV